MKNLCILLLLLCGSVPLGAQTTKPLDLNPTTFREKQDEMITLILKQNPKIKRIDERLDEQAAELRRITDILKFPKNVPTYRDTGFAIVKRIRSNTDKLYDQLKDMNMDWFAYKRHLMAVYTRYGEVRSTGKQDEDLKNFLLLHRENIEKTEALIAKVQDIYNQCDYLLNAKLN